MWPQRDTSPTQGDSRVQETSRRLIAALALTLAWPPAAARPRSSSDSSGGGGTISGAGSTFAQPIISQWGSELKETDGLTVNYNSIGSGGGIAQFQANTVDFGDTDSAMTDEEIEVADKNGTTVHVPIVFGAVTVSYNLPGVESGLKLDGETIGNIFLGKITKWDDPAIAKLNPGVELPGTSITVVHRSDESGTTALFTQFLDETNQQWHSTGRDGQDRQVADRDRRQRQRGRRRRRPADRRRDRLRRARLRAAERIHDRRRAEQGRQVRRPDAGIDLSRR